MYFISKQLIGYIFCDIQFQIQFLLTKLQRYSVDQIV